MLGAFKFKWVGLCLVLTLAMVMALGVACAGEEDEEEAETVASEAEAPEAMDETDKVLVLVEQDWNGQLVTTAVAQILLEQEMGYTVATRFAPADSAPLFIGLEKGDFHFVCCNWPSYSAALLDEYVNAEDATVDRMGPVGIIGETGWYVPSYVINGDAERGINASAPTLSSVGDLDQYKAVFATSDTGDKGRLLEFTAAWDTRPEERLEAFGADYAVVFAGSEGAALAEVDAAFQRGDPVLTYLWEPHWAHAKYNLIQIEMPEYTSDCYPDGTNYNCGFATDTVAKLVWPELQEEFPKAYEFLSNFRITNEQQNEMVLNLVENDLTVRGAAQEWVDANEAVWRAWIP